MFFLLLPAKDRAMKQLKYLGSYWLNTIIKVFTCNSRNDPNHQ